jgi:hypothetical protein
MPFGLKTAPAHFTKAIRRLLSARYGDKTLKDRLGPGASEVLSTEPYAFAYMDDIIIYSDDEESHLEHVKDVLRRVKEFGLKISAEKTHLFKSEVRYLGHIISREGTKMDPEKVRVLKEYPLPQNVAQLHSFVSTVGFYKNFFGKKFTELAKPLREMVQRGSVRWDKSKLECFHKIRDMVAEEKFLKPPRLE